MSACALRARDGDFCIFCVLNNNWWQKRRQLQPEFDSQSQIGFARREPWTRVQTPPHCFIITKRFMTYCDPCSFFSRLNPQNLPCVVPQPPRLCVFTLLLLLLLAFPSSFYLWSCGQTSLDMMKAKAQRVAFPLPCRWREESERRDAQRCLTYCNRPQQPRHWKRSMEEWERSGRHRSLFASRVREAHTLDACCSGGMLFPSFEHFQHCWQRDTFLSVLIWNSERSLFRSEMMRRQNCSVSTPII